MLEASTKHQILPIGFFGSPFHSLRALRILVDARVPHASISSTVAPWPTSTLSTYYSSSTSHTAQILHGSSGEHRPFGLLVRKVGMLSLWDAEDVSRPVTVLCLDRSHVLRTDAPIPDDRNRKSKIQVGADPKRPYGSPNMWRFHCAKAGV